MAYFTLHVTYRVPVIVDEDEDKKVIIDNRLFDYFATLTSKEEDRIKIIVQVIRDYIHPETSGDPEADDQVPSYVDIEDWLKQVAEDAKLPYGYEIDDIEICPGKMPCPRNGEFYNFLDALAKLSDKVMPQEQT